MTTSLSTPAAIINYALSRIGSKQRIGSLLDGSDAAKVALDVYGQVRDDKMRVGDWGFARGDVTLTLHKSAPAGGFYAPGTWNDTDYPPLPWLYSYLYPSDCLKVRAIKSPLLFVPDFDPQPLVFDTPNVPTDDDPPSSIKVIVCNISGAVLTYTKRVTDPTLWEASFTEAFTAALGPILAPKLVGMQGAQIEAVAELRDTAQADVTQG